MEAGIPKIDEDHEHAETFLAVSRAYLDSDNEPTFCLEGRREDCGYQDPAPSRFSMTIPVAMLWDEEAKTMERERNGARKAARRLALVPRRRIGPACPVVADPTTQSAVEFVRLPETESSDYFDGLDGDALQRLKPPEGATQAVFEIPMSFGGREFRERRQLVYVGSRPDTNETFYYQLEAQPLVRGDEVEGSARFVAFVRHVLEFPYQLVMLLSWSH